MSSHIRAALLLPLSLALGGCIFAVGIGSNTTTHESVSSPACPKSLVTQEIDAAAGLNVEASRATALARIARDSSLTSPEQVYLVNAVCNKLSSDHLRQQLLTDLIRNPSFSLDARQAILQHLNDFSMDSSRASILEAMRTRPVPPATQPA